MMDIVVYVVKIVIIVYFFQEILKVVKDMYGVPKLKLFGKVKKEAWLFNAWLRPADVLDAERLLRGRKPKEVKK